MPAPSSSLICAVLGDLAGSPAADRDVLVSGIPRLVAYLAWVPDPRDPRGVRHSLTSLLATAVAAALTGATSLSAIAEWVSDVSPQVLDVLGVRYDRFTRAHQVPDESTIRGLLERLDATAFAAATGAWLNHLVRARSHPEPAPAAVPRQRPRREQIAVDGKALRGTRHHTGNGRARHLLAARTGPAWSSRRSRSTARPTRSRRSRHCCGPWT